MWHLPVRLKDKLDQSPTKIPLHTSTRSRSEDPLKSFGGARAISKPSTAKSVQNVCNDDEIAPPIPPLPTNYYYQRSDGNQWKQNCVC